ncbi:MULTISPECIES: hypothetical protein [Methylomonas]|uniref:Uncharacterized protein n=1 Tax=Methylomonas koyamae TaxID=702114 RepID=A0A177P3J6_9GAMM|nr:hypothetical protein [Methylomonas koyamae]OAI24053.1 hypothetical protein A1355_21040 [Methylomonas koyamae]
MRYHPQALIVAALSAAIGSSFVVNILFPETRAKILAALASDAAPIVWLALLSALIALVFFVKANKSIIDKVLSGRATPAEVWRSFVKPGATQSRKRD